MRLSKRCEYGIKATTRLAQRYGTGYLQSREIAENEALPAKFLEAILLALRSGGVLESKVGAGGGYRLARSPEQILVVEIIKLLCKNDSDNGRDSEPNATPDGRLRVGESALSVVNERLDEAFEASLGSMTVAELVEAAEDRSDSVTSAMYYI